VLARTRPERLLYRQIMVQHHYLGYCPMAGAQLRYPPIQRLPPAGRLGLWRQRLVARRPGSPHWLGRVPNVSAICTWCSTITAFCCCLGCAAQSGLPRTGPGMSPSCRRLVLPLWLPTRPTGNLRPATALYRHGLSRRQLALRRPHTKAVVKLEKLHHAITTTESHLPLSIVRPDFKEILTR